MAVEDERAALASLLADRGLKSIKRFAAPGLRPEVYGDDVGVHSIRVALAAWRIAKNHPKLKLIPALCLACGRLHDQEERILGDQVAYLKQETDFSVIQAAVASLGMTDSEIKILRQIYLAKQMLKHEKQVESVWPEAIVTAICDTTDAINIFHLETVRHPGPWPPDEALTFGIYTLITYIANLNRSSQDIALKEVLTAEMKDTLKSVVGWWSAVAVKDIPPKMQVAICAARHWLQSE